MLARSACRPAGSACGQIIIHSFLTFSENLFLTVFYSTLRVLAGRLGARPAESAGRLVKCDAPVSAVIGDCDRLITITTTIIIIFIIIVIIILKKILGHSAVVARACLWQPVAVLVAIAVAVDVPILIITHYYCR